jgi:hypothetical protein
VDSMASNSFISKACAERSALHTKPTYFQVSLADGSATTLHGECTVYVKLPTRCKATRYLRKVRCYVIDMSDDVDLILGDDWCVRERATLDFHTRTCVLARRGLVLECIKPGETKQRSHHCQHRQTSYP